MTHSFDWKLLHSSYVLKDTWISVRADRCKLPNGRVIEPYYIVESLNWVSIVPVTPTGEIVLVRLYRHGWQQVLWELPGGLIDADDEDASETSRRELLEETGYACETMIPLGCGGPDPARYQATAYYFLAKNARLVAEPAWEETEEMEIHAVPIPQVREMLFQGKIVDTSHQSALFFALYTLNELQFTEVLDA